VSGVSNFYLMGCSMRGNFAIVWMGLSIIGAAVMPWWLLPACCISAFEAGRLLVDCVQKGE
jgi:hypothetical protein